MRLVFEADSGSVTKPANCPIEHMNHRVQYVGQKSAKNKRAEHCQDLSNPGFCLFNINDTFKDDGADYHHDCRVNADGKVLIVFDKALAFAPG